MESNLSQPRYTQELLLAFLANNQIPYEYHSHPAVFTSEQADLYTKDLDGFPAKNLFLTNSKGKRFYLVVTGADGQSAQKINLKMLGMQLAESRLRFASEEKMWQFLGITPGAVTPLGVINDVEKKVEVVFFPEAWQAARIFCHPLENTATLILDHEGLARFFELTGHPPRILAVD